MAIEDRYVLLQLFTPRSYCPFSAVSLTDYPALEKVSESAVKDKQKFERLVVKKETLLEMFAVRNICMHSILI
jgi:threonyl-tRNA synthetase